jgi:uncharacterized protein YkvS
MAKKKYKVGDEVEFYFLGEPLRGIIEKIEEKEMVLSKDKIRYTIFDGKYRYPLPVDNIKNLIK